MEVLNRITEENKRNLLSKWKTEELKCFKYGIEASKQECVEYIGRIAVSAETEVSESTINAMTYNMEYLNQLNKLDFSNFDYSELDNIIISITDCDESDIKLAIADVMKSQTFKPKEEEL